jgi:hypothetical protein
MTLGRAAALLCLTSLACDRLSAGLRDAGPDASTPASFSVRGSVALHPAALSWATATGQAAAPDFVGLTAQLEDPFELSRGAATASLAAPAVVGADSAFAFDAVASAPVVYGVGALLSDPRASSDAGPSAARFATSLTLLASGKPEGDLIGAVAFAVPAELAAALEQRAHLPAGSLESGGAILGSVVDSAGQPVGGAVVEAVVGEAVDIRYPSADWTVFAADQTSAAGSFLALGLADPANLRLAGRPDSMARVVARPGAVTLVLLRD